MNLFTGKDLEAVFGGTGMDLPATKDTVLDILPTPGRIVVMFGESPAWEIQVDGETESEFVLRALVQWIWTDAPYNHGRKN